MEALVAAASVIGVSSSCAPALFLWAVDRLLLALAAAALASACWSARKSSR